MFQYLYITILFSFGVYLFETYLNIRQRRKLHDPNIPKLLENVVEQEKFDKSRLYGLDKNNFILLQSFYQQIESICILYFGALPFAWNFSKNFLENNFQSYENSEIVITIVFFLVTTLYSNITNLPWNLYFTFVLEEKHGFNKQTLYLFFMDMIKSLSLTVVIAVPIISLFLLIIQWAGESFFLYIFIFTFIIQIVAILIYPTLIQPLFNKFDPLPDGELKNLIVDLAKKVQFPLQKIFIMDGSTRSSHGNAYFYGFFSNKRIVIYDTLIQDSTTDEVVAVLAHEIGHWKHNHIFINLFISQVHLFALFYLFNQMITNKDLYVSFGFSEMPIMIGFLLFQMVYSPVEFVLGFFMNILSRKHEFQADHYAKDLGYEKDLKSGLIKLHVSNLGNMNPDPLYSAFHYSHPPLVERLNALSK